MLHQLSIPTGNPNGPEAMAAVLRSVHAANLERHAVELILADRNGSIQFFVDCPLSLRSLLLIHLLDAFPGAKLDRVSDSLFERSQNRDSQCVSLRPELDFEYLRRQFDRHDPMTAVLSLLKGSRSPTSHARIAIRLRPARDRRLRRAQLAQRVHRGRCYSKTIHETLVRGLGHRRFINRLACLIAARCFVGRGKPSPQIKGKLDDCLF